MQNISENELSRRKEAILGKSPLLHAFLDSSYKSNPDVWKITLATELTRVTTERHTSNNQTANNTFMDVLPILPDIFNPSVSHSTQLGTISMIIAIGYEIGDRIEAMMFFNDVRERLNFMNLLHTEPDKQTIIIETLCGVMMSGVEQQKQEIEQASQEFRNFIHKPNTKGK
jgi:hypothetical protein